MRVALDAMGGDLAPGAVVDGAILALDSDSDLVLDLVGREDDIRTVLGEREHARLHVVHAPDVLLSGEAPVRAARSRPASSVHVGLSRVRDGEDDALVSAGDTGGVLAAAAMILGLVRGVRRPGIAVAIPRSEGFTILCDAGANPAARAVHLLQNGLMAAELARTQLGVDEPRVGLLSVGREAGKGTDLVRRADGLLRKAPLRYEGLVEGQDLFEGSVDVVVCDGFTGNAVLKACEGFAGSLRSQLESCAQTFDPRRLDFSTYGGAPLLGVDGVVVIGHGRSGARAVANGVRAAVEGVRRGLVERLAAAAHTMSPLARAARLLPSREGGEGR